MSLMREILFRGKRKDNGEWVEGHYLKGDNFNFIVPVKSKGSYSINDNTVSIDPCCPVIPETIGQYTGVMDKNDKKIFEGDILKFGDFIVFVVWNGETLAWECQKADDIYNSCHYQICKDHWGLIELGHIAAEPYITGEMTTEIIGNIHDNPEFLKGGAES